jgi:hypothetical protein
MIIRSEKLMSRINFYSICKKVFEKERLELSTNVHWEKRKEAYEKRQKDVI